MKKDVNEIAGGAGLKCAKKKTGPQGPRTEFDWGAVETCMSLFQTRKQCLDQLKIVDEDIDQSKTFDRHFKERFGGTYDQIKGFYQNGKIQDLSLAIWDEAVNQRNPKLLELLAHQHLGYVSKTSNTHVHAVGGSLTIRGEELQKCVADTPEAQAHILALCELHNKKD